jgi:hypothetical protein
MSQIDPTTLAFEAARTFPASVAAPWSRAKSARTSNLASGARWAAWIICGAIAFAFLWQPVGVGAQLWLAYCLN